MAFSVVWEKLHSVSDPFVYAVVFVHGVAAIMI